MPPIREDAKSRLHQHSGARRRALALIASLAGPAVLPTLACEESSIGDRRDDAEIGSVLDAGQTDGSMSNPDASTEPDAGDTMEIDAGPRSPTDGCDGALAPILEAVLVDFWIADLPDRRAALAATLPAHFGRATGCRVRLRILDIVAFPVPAHDVADILARYPYMDEADAQRLWYYEAQNVEMILGDLRAGLDQNGVLVPEGALTIVLSDAQFEASAYYLDQTDYGLEPLIIIESHTMGGWSLGPGYTTHSNDTIYLADEVVHELGHFMGLRHACDRCFRLGDYNAMLVCCGECADADDVMSYCRERVQPGDTETNVFLSCTLDWIESGFLPAFMAGNEIPWQPASCGD